MNTNTRVSPKDFFLHLGATIALYASAIAFINLAFEVVNKELPDALSNYYNASSVVWPISMLIVLVPILYIIERLIIRDVVITPEKKDIWIRKWRIYLTLFLTGVTIAVDVIVLINTYLNGEISSRFIWKVIIVLVVSAVIFAYYILAKNATNKSWLRILSIVGIVMALAGIVSGFIIVGSPGTQRALRFDQQRVNDLTNIEYQVTNYWQQTGALPANLEVLNHPISYFQSPLDPETMKPYEYNANIKGSNSFSLCATFDLPSDAATANRPMMAGVTDNWSHAIGHTCFERTIDPKLYPQAPANSKPI